MNIVWPRRLQKLATLFGATLRVVPTVRLRGAEKSDVAAFWTRSGAMRLRCLSGGQQPSKREAVKALDAHVREIAISYLSSEYDFQEND